MSTAPQQTPDPEAARQLRARAQTRFKDGDLEGARRILTEAIGLDPRSAEGHYLLGNCLRLLRQAAEGETAFKTAMELDPGMPEAGFGLAFLYQENGRRREACEQLLGLKDRFPADADLQHKVGGLLAEFGFHAEAAQLYEGILVREPQARNHLRLGQYYQKMGRYEDASRALLSAIELNPDASAAYLALANSRHFGDSAADQALIKRFTDTLSAGTASRTTRICLNFALGKMQDDLEHYDEAFGFFAAGNTLRRAEQGFEPQDWMDVVRRIESVDASWVRPLPAAGGPAPVFIVGMLRSGTTLVERILASHPRVHGLGEISWFSDNIGRMSRMSGKLFPEMLTNLSEAESAGLREDYTRRWPKDSQPVYFVDKFPINFVYLGLLVRIFPGARIVHCRRDARDTALSIYFQNFAHPMHSYAYDLADIGRYYNGYARVMHHWENVLAPGAMHTLRYEELVTDQEQQTRALLAALQLPWDDACLDFDKQPDAISTASLWQARQPLYAQSVGRWRHYERHLKPLLDVLAE